MIKVPKMVRDGGKIKIKIATSQKELTCLYCKNPLISGIHFVEESIGRKSSPFVEESVYYSHLRCYLKNAHDVVMTGNDYIQQIKKAQRTVDHWMKENKDRLVAEEL